MTPEHLEAIFKQAALSDKDGFRVAAEGMTMTLHVAHNGASMSIPRVEGVKREGDLLWARNAKKELAAFVAADVFAVLLDGTPGTPVRRPGFGS